jgi:hypothetical protein
MKKFLIISILALVSIGLFFAGVKDRTRPLASAVVMGQSDDISYLVTGGGVGDTIVVSDTVQIPIVVTHSALVKPLIQMYWDQIGTAIATSTLTFWQSNDGVNYTAVKKGKLQAAYSKSFTIKADTTNFISFALDSVVLEGRFLKLRYITSSTAAVKAKLTHRIKFNL